MQGWRLDLEEEGGGGGSPQMHISRWAPGYICVLAFPCVQVADFACVCCLHSQDLAFCAAGVESEARGGNVKGFTNKTVPEGHVLMPTNEISSGGGAGGRVQGSQNDGLRALWVTLGLALRPSLKFD